MGAGDLCVVLGHAWNYYETRILWWTWRRHTCFHCGAHYKPEERP